MFTFSGRFTGEGTVQGDEVYVPTVGGLAVFALADGAFRRFLPTGETPLKVRQHENLWLACTATAVHVFAAGQNFEGAKAQVVNERATAVVVAEPAPNQTLDFDRLELEGEVDIPFDVASRGIGTVLRTSKPFHHLLVREHDMALLREGYVTQPGHYLAPAFLWARLFPNARCQGDRILSYTAGRLQIVDCFDPGTPLFTFTPPTFGFPLPISHLRIEEAQMADDLVAIRLQNRLLLVYDWKTGRRIFAQENAEGFTVYGRRLCCEVGKELLCYEVISLHAV